MIRYAFAPKTVQLLSLSFFVLMLSACGWQLRGYHGASLSIESVAIKTERLNNPAFLKVFQDTLKNNYQVSVSPNAETMIHFVSIRDDRRVSSRDRNGNTSEYELTAEMKVKIQLANQEEGPEQTFNAVRVQSHNEDKILSSDLQGFNAKTELYQDLTRQLVAYLTRQLELANQEQKSINATP